MAPRQVPIAARLDAAGLRKRLLAAAILLAALFPIALQARAIGSFFLHNVKDEASAGLVAVDMFLHTFVLLLAVWGIFSRRLTMSALAVGLWLALAMEKFNFFAGVVHPMLMALHAYPDWFGHGSTATQSDQYAKLFVSAPIVLLLAARLVRKHDRSIDRMYLTLICGSVLATTLLFHWVTIQGVHEVRNAREVGLRLAAEAPSHLVQPICKELRAQCLTGRISELPVATGDARLDHMLAGLSNGADKQTYGFTGSLTTSQPIGDGADNRLAAAHHVVYHRTRSGDYRFVIETERTVATLKRWQTLYGALAITAHLTWLLGGLHLLFWHRRRMARKQQREIEIHDFVEKRFYEFIQG